MREWQRITIRSFINCHVGKKIVQKKETSGLSLATHIKLSGCAAGWCVPSTETWQLAWKLRRSDSLIIAIWQILLNSATKQSQIADTVWNRQKEIEGRDKKKAENNKKRRQSDKESDAQTLKHFTSTLTFQFYLLCAMLSEADSLRAHRGQEASQSKIQAERKGEREDFFFFLLSES